MGVDKLRDKLAELAMQGDEVTVFDANDRSWIARATSWRGEAIEVVDLALLRGRVATQKAILKSVGGEEKKAAGAIVTRLEARAEAWAAALVRAGFSRPHFGPSLTSEFFRRHVNARERLDVTVDVNAIAIGLVHHIARIAPYVDFSRSAITDLEIQRLADHDRETWRKSCRAIERFPSEGPAWRILGLPDTTALLVARADQKGEKAPGADALLAHNFEEALHRGRGVRCVLLTADNGLARTVAARLPVGTVWVGYVDRPEVEERFLSPILSWPRGSVSESRYSSLAELLDELLVCGVTDHLLVTDGTDTLELRAHLQNAHQYVTDWHDPLLFVRGMREEQTEVAIPVRWPLRELNPPTEVKPSGARVTVDQAATALEWVRATSSNQLSRDLLPLDGDARNEAWNFLRVIDAIDDGGRAVSRAALSTATNQRDMEAIRTMVLRFEPVAKIVTAVKRGARTVVATRSESSLGERTFGSAFGLTIACGLVWRNGDVVGYGSAFVSREDFLDWLLSALGEPVRTSALCEQATRELRVSPVRFREGLMVLLTDRRFVGIRGGSAEAHALDSRVLGIDDDGRLRVQDLSVDDLLGLRSLAVRQ
jgi:hypothetical protein